MSAAAGQLLPSSTGRADGICCWPLAACSPPPAFLMWPQFVNEATRDVHFNIPLFVSLTMKIALAWLLTFPISVERARDDRSAGLRTFPVVAAASCSLVLLAGQVFGISSDQQTHILQGLVTGIGFIGGGAIVREGNHVRGTATAAAIWSTGILGAAVGYGRFEIAVVLSAFTSVTLYVITKYEVRHGLRDPITGESTVSAQPVQHLHGSAR
jgi:putative Mg2+ transporter-C (MgtC) family protein